MYSRVFQLRLASFKSLPPLFCANNLDSESNRQRVGLEVRTDGQAVEI